MNSFEITTSIKDGFFSRNINTIRKVLREFEGKTLILTLKVQRNQRSNPQNRYYWGVIVVIWRKLIEDEWGEFFTAKETHEFLKYNCNYEEKVNKNTGEVFRVSKSTTENTTTEQEEFHIRCRRLAEEMFNVIIPEPEEQIQIEM